MEAPSSWKIVKLIFLRKPDAAPKKGNLELPGFVCYGGKFGFATLVLDQICKVKRSWRFEERCATVHFETTQVGKDLGVEAFILTVTKVLREGRRGGAREVYTTRDLNVELGLCTDEEDIEELKMRFTGPWQFPEADVVWNHEGVQLHMQLGENSKNGRRSWTTSSGLGGSPTMLTSTMASKYGAHGITIRFTR